MLGRFLNRLVGGGGGDNGGVGFDDVRTAIETGRAVVIDVREPGEFAAGHIPGSRNMPLSQFDVAAVPTDRPVILLCQAGARSARARAACAAQHGGNVTHYAPGFAGWRAGGGAVTRG